MLAQSRLRIKAFQHLTADALNTEEGKAFQEQLNRVAKISKKDQSIGSLLNIVLKCLHVIFRKETNFLIQSWMNKVLASALGIWKLEDRALVGFISSRIYDTILANLKVCRITYLLHSLDHNSEFIFQGRII